MFRFKFYKNLTKNEELDIFEGGGMGRGMGHPLLKFNLNCYW